MKQQIMTSIAFFLTGLGGIYAQTISFQQVAPPAPAPQIIADIDGTEEASIAFADIDGDTDQDVLITGLNNSNQKIAKLYTNDGSGNYNLISGTPFDGVWLGSIAFADIDGDTDQDVLITGLNNSNQRIAKLYINDGSGNYSLVSGTPFEGVYLSSIAFADIDGDSDQDVLITGQNSSNQNISKLYINDGSGNYSVSGTFFIGLSRGSIAFADTDGDTDLDVLITGFSSSGSTSRLYINDGSGNYSITFGTPFDGVQDSSIAFADIDGDSDQDVLITGLNSSNQRIAKLYTNDGNGNYSLVFGTSFDGVYRGSIAFADIDGDTDQDVLITGTSSSNQRIAKLYTNDGNGNYSLVFGTPFEGVFISSIAFTDIDGDADQDVLITGFISPNHNTSVLYTNDGSGNYSLVSGTPFEGIEQGSIAFTDIDGDTDQDVLITGLNSSNQRIAKLYINDGNGGYSLVLGTPFDGVYLSSIAFADIDGDSDQDVLITGKNNSNQTIAKLYTNDGSGNYSLVSGTPFDGVSGSSIAFADIDGDSDQDVLITGVTSSSGVISKLYTNNGSGNYSLVSGTPFDGVYLSSIAFTDIDGDADLDVLITGSGSIAKLYTNDGNGNYSLVLSTPFEGVYFGSIAFADIDNDNDQDVLITGSNISNQMISKLYTNDGSGNYSLVVGTPFENVFTSSIAFADVDGDTDQDVLITGQNSLSQDIVKLYNNDGSGNYSLAPGMPFDGVNLSSIAFADIDGDADLDVLITGSNGSNQKIAKLYRNTVCYPNTGIDIQTACNTYTWIDGNTYTNNNNTATHTLTNTSGCDSVVTLNLTINTIDITTSTSGLDIASNQNGATYQWVDCNNGYSPISGETASTYTATVNGDYAVEITTGGCSDTSDCININSVGVDETILTSSITLFPNPTTNYINLVVEDNKNMSYQLSNIQGKIIENKNLNSTSTKINLENLPSAIYFIKVIKNNETVKSFKVTKG